MRDGPYPGDPIAIVGMACRFPGADGLAAFWRLLEEGRNSVIEGIPGSGVGRIGELFPDPVEPDACRFGAYIKDLDLFDPAFFRISSVEAHLLDPQQRMMLEVCWQALEDAGIAPDRLRGSRTGVYAGISNMEYRPLALDSDNPDAPAPNLYALTGTTLNSVSGRVSYVLGLEGPSMAVDAACSSSLVALHQAITGLQQGEADLALAGGVQAVLDGRAFEVRAISGMLSPDGQCKAFDAAANGFVRGEGCGMVALKRLSDAEADGDRIWGVIRGSAVNHVGASAGLTVPHGPAQRKVIADALYRAGVNPADVDYLEAHGTGTEVGDPIEIDAAVAVYGNGRESARPLLVGSVKTNIGHLEPAAGIAGLIKTMLAMQQGMIPKQLHFHNPNPRVDWAQLPVKITSEPTQWPRRPGRPLLAGVSSYGISGTNSHVVVESHETSGASPSVPYTAGWAPGTARVVETHRMDAVEEAPPKEGESHHRRTRFLPISGKTDGALKDLASLYLSWLDERSGTSSIESRTETGEREALADMAWTASVGRSHFAHRAGVPFQDAASLRDALTELADADDRPKPRPVRKTAFFYTGQGSQWVGMGRELYETEPVARAVFDRCERVFREERSKSLLDVMFGRCEGEEDLSDTAWEQPALYALECALTALWASVGIRPAVVVGHSVGELAACQAAEVFSLEDGMRLAAKRGTLLSATAPGAMVAVFAPPDLVRNSVQALNAESSGVGLSLAADNGTHQVVSGPVEMIEAISERLETQEVRVRRLNTSRAFHSGLLEPAQGPLEAYVNTLDVQPPAQATLISNVTGRVVGQNEPMDGAYWSRHARAPVAFASGVRTLAELGVDAIVEIGPHSVLGPMASLCWPEPAGTRNGGAPVVFTSLRRPPRGEAEPESGFVEAVAAAYEAGLDISFTGLFAGEARRKVSLPSYPFQRTRHWVEATKRLRYTAGHPLPGVRHESARGGALFESEISLSAPAWLSDHRVFGRVVAPGAMYAAMAAMALYSEGTGSVIMEDMQLHSPLIFPEDSADAANRQDTRQLQLALDAEDETRTRRVGIFSKGTRGTEEGWTLHLEGRLSLGTPTEEDAESVDLQSLKAKLSPQGVPEFFEAKSASGLEFGPAFRGLEGLWCGTGEALGEIALPESADSTGLDVHPLLIDGCFQVMSAARDFMRSGDTTTYMPFGWERLRLSGRLPQRIVCHARIRDSSRERGLESSEPPETVTSDLWLYDPAGFPLGKITGFVSKRATRNALLSATEGVNDLLYEIVWREKPVEKRVQPADFLETPSVIGSRVAGFTDYLAGEGVEVSDRIAVEQDLARLAHGYAFTALESLGWNPEPGSVVDPEELRASLGILPEHRLLLGRMLEMLADEGILTPAPAGGWTVTHERGLRLVQPGSCTDAPGSRLYSMYPHASNEIGLLQRCGGALAEVLAGRRDALELLFGSEPNAANLYGKASVSVAANRMAGDAVAAAVSVLPEERHLRVLEVGAGTGSATEVVLNKLPAGRFEYTFTDISAGFFGDAEKRFRTRDEPVEFKVLDIEVDPVNQGFDRHGYDIVVAVNVIHATRDLGESLAHCRDLLAPSGELVILEILSGKSWRDLVFGLIGGWWRFDDDYRPEHALASPAVWRRAIQEAGFVEVQVLGADSADGATPERGVIVARGPDKVSELPGTWVITAGGSETAELLAGELTARNQTVLVVDEEAQWAKGYDSTPCVIRSFTDVTSRDAWRSLLESMTREAPLRGVVHLAALNGRGARSLAAELQEDVSQATSSALAMVQALIDVDAQPEGGVWFVTSGAQVLAGESGDRLAGATLWGFGRVVAREAPQLQARVVDLDPSEAVLPESFVDGLLHLDQEHQIAYRNGIRRVARLVRSGRQGALENQLGSRVRDDRTYLVTGGLGGIGCAVAAWLAEQGAGAIVLNGRRPPDPEAEEAIAALRRQGARVRVELADVCDTAALDDMLARVDAELPPLGGLIHSVGVLSDGALTNQTWDRFQRVLWPKIVGAWHLHRATEDRDLDLFVLFSSMSGIRGNPGQGNHAAANTFLDQLAAHRRALGLPGQSVQWGSWAGLGEAEEQRERIEGLMEASGSGWMTPEQGIKALDHLVRQDVSSSAVAYMDWAVFAANLPRQLPFIEELLPRTTVQPVSAPSHSTNFLAQLEGTPSGERENLLVSFLQGELQAMLRLPSRPSPTVGFVELGMDSLMAVQLRNRLNRAMSGEYTAPNTVVFDYPDIASLARHLAGALAEKAEAQPEPRPPERFHGKRKHESGIAIVGMACRFPGADGLAAFWRLLESGGSAVSDDRPGAGNLAGLNGDNSGVNPVYRKGAYINDIDQFDAAFFRIAPIEARNMDPQQRLLLETSWQALDDAGIDPDRLRSSRTGVYAGIGNSEYRDLMRNAGSGVNYLGTSGSMAVGRVAFVLGLEGPTIPVELACASSLAAVHQAVCALQQGEVDMALAGGVNAVLSDAVTREMAQIGMLSPNGQCKTFDADADGYVRGEGCGMVALKRLSDAEADGDRIWGVILGSAVNQNGVSAGPTVPNGPAQERVIEEALSKAGVVPGEVDYLEAHGVGSGLGDPIEAQAASAVYSRGRDRERPLLIGSVKTNIGHLEVAAGIAALIKTVLAMKKRLIPMHLNFKNPTPHLDWDSLPIKITAEATEWPVKPGQLPMAGVSAFGMQGSNVHLVVEGYKESESEDALSNGETWPAGPARKVGISFADSLTAPALPENWLNGRKARFLPLSGKSREAVQDLAKQYMLWMDERADILRDAAVADRLLADMAWTAGIGRCHFAYRAAVAFRDLDTLREGLNAVAQFQTWSRYRPDPPTAAKAAFSYAGPGSRQVEIGRELYYTQSVARAVLDRCEVVFRQERGESLLDAIFAWEGAMRDHSGPAWDVPYLYALECALTAMWASVGIRPVAVAGQGPGKLAAAQAMDLYSLEEGMGIAASGALSPGLDAVPDDVPVGESGADLVVLIGQESKFMEAVASAYDAGFQISFSGVFAGESRRRISLPGYPFQRRSHWLEESAQLP